MFRNPGERSILGGRANESCLRSAPTPLTLSLLPLLLLPLLPLLEEEELPDEELPDDDEEEDDEEDEEDEEDAALSLVGGASLRSFGGFA